MDLVSRRYSPRSSAIAGTLAVFLLGFFAMAVVMGWIDQWAPAGVWLRRQAFLLALLGAAGMAYGLSEGRRSQRLYTLLGGMVFLGLLLALAKRYLDFTWDGLAYHQKAVAVLMHGGNFLANDAPSGNLWVDGYAKATWFYAATLLERFGRVELGASYHFVLAAACGVYAYRFCRMAGRGSVVALLLAVLVAGNPVTIAQWYTYYNDAAVGALSTLLFLAAAAVAREGRLLDRAVFISSAVLVVNVKASGIIFVGVAFFYVFLARWLAERRFRDACIASLKSFVLFFVLGFCVLGYSPYMQNVIHGRHIFHPLAGAAAVDIMTANAPPGFMEHNRFRNLALSLFSYGNNSSSAAPDEPIRLKMPGEIGEQELDVFLFADPRIGGFGPLFSLMLCLSVITVFGCRIDWGVAGPWLFLIGLTLVIHPYAWWARYCPVIWVLPLVPIMSAVSMRRATWVVVPASVIFAGLVNDYLIVERWRNYYVPLNAVIREKARVLRGQPLKVFTGPFSPELELNRFGLTYQYVTEDYYEAHKADFVNLSTGITYQKE